MCHTPQFLSPCREGVSPAALDSLCQGCLIILSMKKFVLIPNLSLPWNNLRLFANEPTDQAEPVPALPCLSTHVHLSLAVLEQGHL